MIVKIKSVHIDDYFIRDTVEEFNFGDSKKFHGSQEIYDGHVMRYLKTNKSAKLLDYEIIEKNFTQAPKVIEMKDVEDLKYHIDTEFLYNGKIEKVVMLDLECEEAYGFYDHDNHTWVWLTDTDIDKCLIQAT